MTMLKIEKEWCRAAALREEDCELGTGSWEETMLTGEQIERRVRVDFWILTMLFGRRPSLG